MVGIANFLQIFSAVALVVIAIVLVMLLKQMLEILKEVHSMVQYEVRKDLLPSVTATMKNVERMSTDAADTTHNVTGAVNRVSNLVGTAATKMESPVIRAVGLLSGVLAAGRAAKKAGGKGEEKSKKKRRGFFG
jgi:hypothetical protein